MGEIESRHSEKTLEAIINSGHIRKRYKVEKCIFLQMDSFLDKDCAYECARQRVGHEDVETLARLARISLLAKV